MTLTKTSLPESSSQNGSNASRYLFWSVAIFSVLFSGAPVINWFMGPITQFTTMVHEFGHALFCLGTGGSVTGLTIVSDGAGHGGLTWCRGGNPFIYTQTGYLGTAVFGAFLLYLAQYQRLSKPVLTALGVIMGLLTLTLMGANVFHTGWAGFFSFLWGLTISGFLFWAGTRFRPAVARILLMFLAVQTALNSVQSIVWLVQIYTGFLPSNAYSDASDMARLSGVPALVWSLGWVLCSILLIGSTMWATYGLRRHNR